MRKPPKGIAPISSKGGGQMGSGLRSFRRIRRRSPPEQYYNRRGVKIPGSLEGKGRDCVEGVLNALHLLEIAGALAGLSDLDLILSKSGSAIACHS